MRNKKEKDFFGKQYIAVFEIPDRESTIRFSIQNGGSNTGVKEKKIIKFLPKVVYQGLRGH